MTIEVTGMLHHGVRVGPTDSDAEEARRFYAEVLGLEADQFRPDIPGLPGFWMNVGAAEPLQQIHLMACEGMSPFAKSEREDPVTDHIALSVADIQAAEEELQKREIPYFSIGSIVGAYQLFLRDPAGNMVELQQDRKSPDMELVARARALAENGLASGDLEARRAAVAQSGLLALSVPIRFGGLGAKPSTCARVVSEIAKACPDTALAFATHCGLAALLGEIEDEGERSRRLGAVVGGAWLDALPELAFSDSDD